MSFEIGEGVIESNSNYCLEVQDYNCTGNDSTICLINSTKQWSVVSKINKLDNGKGIFNVGEIESTDLILLQFNCNDESVYEGTLTINKNIVLYKQ